MIVYQAKYVLPVVTPPLRDGAVAVEDGRIVAVGSADEIMALAAGQASEARQRTLGRVAILPGLVNAHTHLELSWAREAVAARGDWVAWVRELVAARAETAPETAREAAARSLAEVVRRGTVAVGDVANDRWITPLLARTSLHGVAFLEAYGLHAAAADAILCEVTARRDALLADPDVEAAARRLAVVPAPHAPHTTSAALLRGLARCAAAGGQPLTIHVAESAAESAWLRDGSGPLGAFYRDRGFVDASWRPPAASPVTHLHRLGLLSPRTLAVHCVQVDADDRALLRASGATVVTCPRSNRALGLGTAPVLELLREGVPVALGTDSLASCPDLDLFAEMAALRSEHPQLAPAAIVHMATLAGARALAIDDRLGSLEAGKLATAIVVPLPESCEDPAAALCSLPAVVHPLESAPCEERES